MQHKILVVDDSRLFLAILEKKLNHIDKLKPYFAQSYEEAKALIEQNDDFFAALLDLILPDAPNGEIVDFVLSKNIPSVVLTASIEDELRDKMLRKPIVDYVVKNSEDDISYAVFLIEKLTYFRGKKALVVDDSSTYRHLAMTFFQDLLFMPIQAKDGRQALELLRQHPDIKIVLTDYNMPQMNGIELVQAIRKNFFRDDLVVIAFTGHHSSDLHSKFLKYGADDYLQKPFNKEEFNCRIVRSMRIVEQLEKLKENASVLDKYVLSSVTDTNGIITHVSDAFARVCGYEKEEMTGRNHNLVRHPDMPSEFFASMWATIKSGLSWHGEAKNKKRDGTAFWVDMHIDPIFDDTKRIIGYSAVRHDITDRKRAEELSITDPLTKTYNRIMIDEAFENELSRANRYKHPFSVVIFDIDHFKNINDSFGHQAGDYALKEICDLVRGSIRASDVLGRWGGEEFIIITPESGLQNAVLLAEKIRRVLEGHSFGTLGRITASFGVAEYESGDSQDSLIKKVDEMLYQAKKEGRNRVLAWRQMGY